MSQAGDRAEALLKRMSENGLVPNMVTYQLVFEALIKSSKGRGKGRMARAESLLKQIDERSKSVSGKKKPLRPNTMLANMILQGKFRQFIFLVIDGPVFFNHKNSFKAFV